MLSISQITKRYGSLTALDSVSLEVSEGECLGLLGPNGAGKSTLMSLIAGIKQADTGELSLNGMPISITAEGPRKILGLVPQAIALYHELTADQNLRLFGELAGLSGALLRERIDEALIAVQLQDRRSDQVKTYSGGMQRRLNLIASLLHRPRLLLCDEPTVGVDPQSRNAIFEFLNRLRATGTTIVYSTHYMEEAERLCSRIAIIDHGKILAQGTLDELLSKLPFEDEIRFPATEATAALLPGLAGRGELQSSPTEHRFRPSSGMPLSAFYLSAEALRLPARLFAVQRPTLENVFLHLTGRTLRE